MNGEPLVKWSPAISLGDVVKWGLTLVLFIVGYVQLVDRVGAVEKQQVAQATISEKQTELIQSIQVTQATEMALQAELQRRLISLEEKGH